MIEEVSIERGRHYRLLNYMHPRGSINRKCMEPYIAIGSYSRARYIMPCGVVCNITHRLHANTQYSTSACICMCSLYTVLT